MPAATRRCGCWAARSWATALSESDKAARLDPLALFSLLLGAYAVATGVAQMTYPWPAPLLAAALIAVGFAQLWSPRRFALTATICFLLLVSYALRSPIGSNNQLMSSFLAMIVLLAVATLRPWDRAAAFRRIAGPGRWLLAVMYFYGIFHKINADFLDPQVSCAVELYRTLVWPLGLEDWIVGRYGAIYVTFVAEVVAMALLFSRRWKKVGFLIGLPFHIAIGLSSYSYYVDFCLIVFTTYALFLPPSFFTGLNGWLARQPRLRLAGVAALTLLATNVLVALYAWRVVGVPLPQPFMPLFAMFGFAMVVAVWRWLPWRRDEGDLPALYVRPAWLAAIPVLFLLNGAGPYVGLRTEASIAMFSNLHTEAGETNHLLFPAPPYLFGYQRNVGQLVAIGERHLERPRWLVDYEIDRIRALHPGTTVLVERDSVVAPVPTDARNSYAETPLLLRRLLLFKDVDFARPKACSH